MSDDFVVPEAHKLVDSILVRLAPAQLKEQAGWSLVRRLEYLNRLISTRDGVSIYGYSLEEIYGMIMECKLRRGDEPMIPVRIAELALKEQNEMLLRTWGEVVNNQVRRHD